VSARPDAYKEADTTVQSPSLVVFEQGRRWIDQLVRSLRGRDVQPRHTATTADCLARVGPGCVGLLVVLGNRPAAAVQLIASAAQLPWRRFPIVVIASADHSGLEMGVRELGSTLFLMEPFPKSHLDGVLGRITTRHG
jgi:hypothetical protein